MLSRIDNHSGSVNPCGARRPRSTSMIPVPPKHQLHLLACALLSLAEEEIDRQRRNPKRRVSARCRVSRNHSKLTRRTQA